MLKQIINQDSPGDPEEGPAGPSVFGSQEPNTPKASPSRNILAQDVEIKGTLKFDGDLIIDGQIEGEIVSEGHLTVGENANLKADIRTKSVTVFGRVRGSITVTERCELKKNAELHGDVSAGKLAIEEGAVFMGASTAGAAASGQSTEEDDPSA